MCQSLRYQKQALVSIRLLRLRRYVAVKGTSIRLRMQLIAHSSQPSIPLQCV